MSAAPSKMNLWPTWRHLDCHPVLSPGHPVTLVRPGWSPRGMRRIRGVARLRLNGHCDIVASCWGFQQDKGCKVLSGRSVVVWLLGISLELLILQISFTPNIILASSQLSVVCHEGFLNGSSLEQNSHAELVGYLWPKLDVENFRCQPPSGKVVTPGAGHEVLSWKYTKT